MNGEKPRFNFGQQRPRGCRPFEPEGIPQRRERAQPSEYRQPRTIEEAILSELKKTNEKLDLLIKLIGG